MERLENIAENNSRQARPSCDKSVRVIPREVFRAPHPGNDRNRLRAPNFLGPADDITSGPFRKGPEEKMEQGMGNYRRELSLGRHCSVRNLGFVLFPIFRLERSQLYARRI